MAQKTIKLEYTPQPKQALLHKCKAKQVLFGGAAGGGKSHAGRWDIIGFCLENPGLQAFIFSRSLPELDANHIQPLKRELPQELGSFNETRKRYEFSMAVLYSFSISKGTQTVTASKGQKYTLPWWMKLGSLRRISWGTSNRA